MPSLISNFITGPGQSTQPAPANLAAITKATDDLLSFQAAGKQAGYNAQAADLQSLGALGEEAAYRSAGDIAQQNAVLAGVAGDIQVTQQQRAAARTIGAQQAGVAANGLASSGSAISLLKSSLQQSYLGKQLIEAQTGINQGSYLEEGAAVSAESAATQAAGAQAQLLSKAETDYANTANMNAVNETAALTDYLKTVTPTLETQLAVDVISGAPAGTTLDDIGKVTGAGSRSVFTGNGWAPAGTVNIHTGKPFAI